AAARIFDDVLSGRGTPAQENAVVANAAFAIRNFEPAMPIADCIAKSRESIASGSALRTFKRFVELNS
ncbi:MAG: anthranilate phosphoribosyltransferase, partial [Alistipes sp.]|nr:anthranilate phosphoribosyltransferase [Alistipes sp.]